MLNYKKRRKQKAYFLVGLLSFIFVWGCNNQAKEQELEKQKYEDSIRIAENVKKELEEKENTKWTERDKNPEGLQQGEVNSNSDEPKFKIEVQKLDKGRRMFRGGGSLSERSGEGFHPPRKRPFQQAKQKNKKGRPPSPKNQLNLHCLCTNN